jgi:hypothetical protein
LSGICRGNNVGITLILFGGRTCQALSFSQTISLYQLLITWSIVFDLQVLCVGVVCAPAPVVTPTLGVQREGIRATAVGRLELSGRDSDVQPAGLVDGAPGGGGQGVAAHVDVLHELAVLGAELHVGAELVGGGADADVQFGVRHVLDELHAEVRGGLVLRGGRERTTGHERLHGGAGLRPEEQLQVGVLVHVVFAAYQVVGVIGLSF